MHIDDRLGLDDIDVQARRSMVRKLGLDLGRTADQQHLDPVELGRRHGAGDFGSRSVVPAHRIQRDSHSILLVAYRTTDPSTWPAGVTTTSVPSARPARISTF